MSYNFLILAWRNQSLSLGSWLW